MFKAHILEYEITNPGIRIIQLQYTNVQAKNVKQKYMYKIDIVRLHLYVCYIASNLLLNVLSSLSCRPKFHVKILQWSCLASYELHKLISRNNRGCTSFVLWSIVNCARNMLIARKSR